MSQFGGKTILFLSSPCVVRLNITCCLDIRRTSNVPTASFLLTLLLEIKFLSQRTLLIKVILHSSCSSLISVPCQLTKLFKQTDCILLQEPGGTSLSWYYAAPACSFCSQVQLPCDPVWHVVSSRLWVYVTIKMLLITRAQSQWLCSQPFPQP